MKCNMNKKKIIRNVILVLAILILLIILLVNIGDIKSIWGVIKEANGWFILLAIGLLLAYAIFHQASLMILTKHRYKEIGLVDNFTISGSEFFFNAITPFSSGGQPFQAYALKRKKMKLSDSTSVLLINFIAYQVCLNIIAIIFLIIYYGRVRDEISSYIWFLIVGFIINIIVMLILLSIGTIKPVGNLFLKLFDLICKIKPLRRFQNRRGNFEEYISNVQSAFKEISKNIKIWICVLITKILSFGIYYAIPFVALYAIGIKISWNDLPYVMALTAFTLTIAIWVPTPGGSGGVEAAFHLLFSPLILSYGFSDSKNYTLAIMLIWRMVTYYLLIIYGFVLYLVFEKRNKIDDNLSMGEIKETI